MVARTAAPLLFPSIGSAPSLLPEDQRHACQYKDYADDDDAHDPQVDAAGLLFLLGLRHGLGIGRIQCVGHGRQPVGGLGAPVVPLQPHGHGLDGPVAVEDLVVEAVEGPSVAEVAVGYEYDGVLVVLQKLYYRGGVAVSVAGVVRIVPDVVRVADVQHGLHDPVVADVERVAVIPHIKGLRLLGALVLLHFPLDL
ncbi:MAG: hypothetical protein J5674_04890 [Candidatus Methanomethylophilaceae archaeon]|nr:hypothetical protein [Candidatus Methanomethylophilaceae archaeon]